MKNILEQRSVSDADVDVLAPAIAAFVRGRIDSNAMARVLTQWLHGESYDLGAAESLPDRVSRSLAMDGPASAKDLATRIASELDSVYHALFRLQKRQIVRCDRSKRPYVWELTSATYERSKRRKRQQQQQPAQE